MYYTKCENIYLPPEVPHFSYYFCPSGTENTERESIKHIRTTSVNIWKHLITFFFSHFPVPMLFPSLMLCTIQ